MTVFSLTAPRIQRSLPFGLRGLVLAQHVQGPGLDSPPANNHKIKSACQDTTFLKLLRGYLSHLLSTYIRPVSEASWSDVNSRAFELSMRQLYRRLRVTSARCSGLGAGFPGPNFSQRYYTLQGRFRGMVGLPCLKIYFMCEGVLPVVCTLCVCLALPEVKRGH